MVCMLPCCQNPSNSVYYHFWKGSINEGCFFEWFQLAIPYFFWRGPTQTFIFLTGSNALPYVFDGFQRSPLFFWRVPMQSLIFWRVPMQSLIFFDGFQRSPLFFLTGSNAIPYFFWRVPIHLFFLTVFNAILYFFDGLQKKSWQVSIQCLVKTLDGSSVPHFLTGSNATNQKNWWVSMQPVKTFDGSSIPHIFWRVPIPSIKKFDGCQCNPSKLLTAFIAARQNFWRLPMRSVKHSIGNIAPKQKNKPTPCHHFFDGYRRCRSNVEIFLVHWKICATIFILEIQAPKLPCRTQIFANKLISSAFLQPFCKTSCSSNCSVLGAPLIFWWFSTLILSNSCP